MTYSSDDLVYIHDAGFRKYVKDAEPGLLAVMREHGIKDGLVTDLGSGTGRWASELVKHGYECVGFDQSAAMVRYAKKVAPDAQFRKISVFDAPLPQCRAVTSIGECLNYRFEGTGSSMTALKRLFAKVYRALEPGGVFVFDLATPARAPKSQPRVHRAEGGDWKIVSVSTAILGGLRRRITFFRKHGDVYRRGSETHDLKLYPVNDVVTALRSTGFQVKRLSHLEGAPGMPGMTWVVAWKGAAKQV
jgi:SAM-dependent methyltransferase